MSRTLDDLAQVLCNSFYRDTATWYALKAAGLEGPWRDVANTATLALQKRDGEGARATSQGRIL